MFTVGELRKMSKLGATNFTENSEDFFSSSNKI
jgi:hypothetical protein